MKYILILAFTIPVCLFSQSASTKLRNTDLNGCCSNSKFMSIASVFSKDDHTVYPNPAADFISIRNATGKFKVVNANGWNVSDLILRSGENKALFDIRDLLPGLYFIQFENGLSTTFIKM